MCACCAVCVCACVFLSLFLSFFLSFFLSLSLPSFRTFGGVEKVFDPFAVDLNIRCGHLIYPRILLLRRTVEYVLNRLKNI